MEGFPTRHWGPGLWKFMHMAALNVRPNASAAVTKQYVNFFRSLGYVMPCGVCRREYRKLTFGDKSPLRITETVFKNRMSAFRWTVALHDAVTRRVKNANKVHAGKDWGAYYETQFRYKPGFKNLTNVLKTNNDAQSIVNLVQTSLPTVLLLTPQRWRGWAYNRGMAAETMEIFKKSFGRRVRFAVVPASMAARVFKKEHGGAGTYMIFKSGQLVMSVKDQSRAMLAVNRLLR